MKTKNRVWQFVARPDGSDVSSALSLISTEMPQVAPGTVLVRNHYLSMDAGTRMWMTDREDGYNPPLEIDTPMVGVVLGEVVASEVDSFAPGDWVRGFGQWADYSLCGVPDSGLVKVDPEIGDLKEHLGVFGMNAWTALWGIRETAAVQAGDNVVVSAAAGATGVMACQVARNLGANVYGLAGSDAKCRWLEATLGVTQAFNYKTDGLSREFARIPGGVNAYFDNVGGDILDAVLTHMALHGRIAVCGLLAQYRGDGRGSGPANYDQVLMKRLRIEGFFSPDFFDQGEHLNTQLAEWHAAGDLFMPFDVTVGLQNTVAAYGKLFSGDNTGKVLVEVAG